MVNGRMNPARERQVTARWARMRNSRTPAGFRPNGWPFGVPSRCRLSTFESAKSKEMDGWGMRNGTSPAGCRHARAGQRCGGALPQVTARWARMRNSRTPAGFRPNGWPFGVPSRCRLSTFESAKSKEMDGWGMRNGTSPAGCRHARAGQRCGGALPATSWQARKAVMKLASRPWWDWWDEW